MSNEMKTWLTAIVTVLCLSISVSCAAQSQAKPNVIVILADDLGWTDTTVGAICLDNASGFYETPNLQRMSDEGMSFTSVYTAPNCAPMRGMYVSGQYMTRTGLYAVWNLNRGGRHEQKFRGPDQVEDVPAEVTNIYEMMKSAGYTTAHFGKYHVGGHEGGEATMPKNQGVDHNFGGGPKGNPGNYFPREDDNYHDSVGPALDAYAQPYDDAYAERYRTYTPYRLPASLNGSPKHLGDAVGQAAVEFIRDHAGKDKPFFMQYNPYLVHTPIQGRRDLVAAYRQKLAGGRVDPRHGRADYAAMVTQLDQQVGRVLAALNDPNGDGDTSDSIADHTLVIFTSDNGGVGSVTNNTPLKGHKGMFTEGGTRVPMIAWMPGRIEAGAIRDDLVYSVDFYTTLAEVAGVDPHAAPEPKDGTSFAGVMFGTGATRDKRAIYWHFPGYLDSRAKPTSAILRQVGDDRYKLLYYYETRTYTLYNITRDIGETTDLLASDAGREAHGRLAAAMSAELRGWLDETGAIYPLYEDGPDAGKPIPAPEPYTP